MKRPPRTERRNIRFDEVPGYLEAVRRETEGRTISFLDVNHTVCGFVLTPFTIEKYAALRLVRSPLLTGGLPEPHDIGQVLWFFSPEYSPKAAFRRWLFIQRVRRMCVSNEPLHPETWQLIVEKKLFLEPEVQRRFPQVRKLLIAAEIIRKLRDIIDDAFSEVGRGGGEGKEYYSDLAHIVGRIASAYGWEEEYVWKRLPLKRAFQYLKEIRDRESNGQAPMKNPSDDILAEFTQRRNEERKQKKGTEAEDRQAGRHGSTSGETPDATKV